MKAEINKKKFMIVLLILFMSPVSLLAAEEIKPSASFDVSFYSQYIWRGYALSDESLVIQPSATGEYHGVSMNLWANLDTDFVDATAASGNFLFTEGDVTLAYDRSFGSLSTGVGYIYYGASENSQEAYISLGVDVITAPSFTVYRDMDAFPGWYFSFGLSHSFEFGDDGISLDIAGSIGYIDPDGDGAYLNDGLISMAVNLPFLDYFTLSPTLAYSLSVSDDAEDDIEAGSADGEANHFYAGATVSMAF